ncbi:hypothetical protein M6G63_18600 [Pseudomonas sp. BYT-5]|uniref:hypothetical protein n=1 Tax=unclassified Pseudomonas TaxID=196821 RepID=UPI00201FBCBE|nr:MULTISPECIES: hypothetical protein [unclassified Pseudomonas]URD41436.1 hypothetical protein M6G63_18600 [Pseudomonas sp. BYT-5]URK96787.1 hypothetical protein J5X93_19265 [Pseudomonas sp. BYT-1]
MSKTGLSSFEAGVMSALGAISLYLRSRPDYDEAELRKYVDFFKNTRQPDADSNAFNLPLDAVGGDLSNVQEAIKRGVGVAPR